MIFGVRVVARYMLVAFVVVWVGMIAWLIAMAVGSHGHFVQLVERALGHHLRRGARAGQPRGFSAAGGIGWGATLFGMIYCFQVYTGFQWTGYFAGRDPQRPPHRHHLDPRRAADLGDRLRASAPR